MGICIEKVKRKEWLKVLMFVDFWAKTIKIIPKM